MNLTTKQIAIIKKVCVDICKMINHKYGWDQKAGQNGR